MTETTEGACLCGAVRFRISGAFERFFLCHCGRCRKGTGSAHAANLFSSSAKIEWLAGEDKIKAFRLEGTRHARSFCADCGSPVPSVQFGGRLLVTPAGGLDTAIDIRPEAHICLASRAEWDEELEAVPKLDGMPG